MIAEMRVDHLFLGVDGLEPETGPMTPDILEAELNAAMIRSAREVTVVTDSSKIGRSSLSLIAPITSVHRIITIPAITPLIGLAGSFEYRSSDRAATFVALVHADSPCQIEPLNKQS